MKINRIKTKICTVFLLVILVGCNPLQIDPVDTVSDEQFWQNADLSRAYVNNFYFWAPQSASQYLKAETWSDNAVGNVHTHTAAYCSYEMTQRKYTSWTLTRGTTVVPWDDAFKRIRAVNIGLEKLPLLDIEAARLNQMMGETYFFRAWVYFELIQYLGGVPIVDKSLTVYDETMIPRSSREASFDFVLRDLDLAIQQFKDGGGTPELGYVGLDAALAFKSRVALYAACAAEAFENNTYSSIIIKEEERALLHFEKNSSVYYQQAYDAAKDVYGKYSLEPNYADLFNTEKGHLSKEVIWPVLYKEGGRDGFNPGSVHGPNSDYYEFQYDDGGNDNHKTSYGITGSAFPTQDLVDDYYQKDEEDGIYKQWWKTKQVSDSLNGSIDANGNFSGSGENYRVMFKDRDPRFYATIVYDGAIHRKHLVQTWIDTVTGSGENLQWSSLHTGFKGTALGNGDRLQPPGEAQSHSTITSYYPAKYMPEKDNNTDGSINTRLTSLSYCNLRYAEVLLNYAEAAYKLGKLGETEKYVNEIRNRVGIGEYNQAAVGHDIWEEYKLQRRIEFAFEVPAHRYYDLLRWGESDGLSVIPELNKYTKCLLIVRKGIEENVKGKIGWPVPVEDPEYFVPQIRTERPEFEDWNNIFDSPRYYFMPFPSSMLSSYIGLVQNPGWGNIDVE